MNYSNSEKSKAARARWNKENMSSAATLIKKSDYEKLKKYCEIHNISISALLKNYIYECISGI